MHYLSNLFTNGTGLGAGLIFAPIFLALTIWSIIWKGLALWKAAQKKHKVWFWVLIFINTLGILDILYLYIFSKKPHKN